MAPVLYFLAKALRMGTGSLYDIIRGYRATSLHNEAQFFQCPSTAAVLLVLSPSAMLSLAVWKISQKKMRLAGSTVTMVTSVGRLCPCERVVRHR